MNAKEIVGDFFEDKVIEIFNLIKTNDTRLPDLVSKSDSYFVEVKGSHYKNGGVINSIQLNKFKENINKNRFYAFGYHSIQKIFGNYNTEEELKKALDLKSLYLFPFSIVQTHFEKSKKVITLYHDNFVQLKEKQASDIFNKKDAMWEKLNLNKELYNMINLHKKVKLITREGHLEKSMLNSFHSEFV